MTHLNRILSKCFSMLALALVLISAAGPALADPATMIIAGLAGSGITVSATAAFAIRIGVGLAMSALATALSSPANANGAPKGIVLRSTTTGEQIPQSFILGRYVTAGNLAAPEMSHGVNGDMRYLTRVIDLSDVQVDGLESLIIDGVACTLATGSPATLTMTQGDGTTPAIHPDYGPTVNKGDFIGFAWCRFRDGSQTTTDPMLMAKYAAYPQRPWTSAMVGRGVAQAILTFLWRDSPQVWQGRPDVRFVVKGIRLYDPRKDSTAGGSGAHRYTNPATHEWSENPVVMIYNLLRGIQIPGGPVFGGGFTAADLPYATWAAAMNACDVMIGDRKTYVAGLEVVMGGADAGGSSPADVIEELLKACSGQIADVGGTLTIRVGAPGLPVKFITDDDILVSQSQELDPFPGAQDSHNIVHATWMSPGNLWTPKEATPRRDEDAIAADGQELPAALALPAVTVPGQVQQLMTGWLKDAQRHRRQSITLPPDGILLKPLDVIDWTSTRNGYTGKDFEIGQVGIDPMTLCTTLALREVDPADYDWAAGDDIAVTAPSVEPVIPGPVTVPGFTATATTIKDGSGADRLPALRLGWTLPLAGVSAVRFQIRVSGSNTVAVEGSTANVDVGYHVVSAGIVGNVAYQARARLVGPKTTEWTAWVTVTAPDVGITGADFQGSIEEVFRNAGLAPVEIVTTLPTTGNFEGRTVYLTTDNKLYRWTGTAWTAAVETVDLVGQIVADQVASGAITTAKFATGLAPVEIVASLPATGNFAGRTVFLTTDGKLYRHTGSPTGSAGFTAAVPAVDVTGQLTDAQIAAVAAAKLTGQITAPQIAASAVTADKIAAQAVTTAKFASGIAPVEIVAALPTTGNFEGRTVYLTTDDKVYRHTGSAFVSTVPATDITGQLLSAQIADAAITTAKFAAGIEPVEIVATLPTTGNFAGRIVFLTSDNKLYRHNGTAFVSTVPATDITGQLVATQIADAAITTAKFASGIAPVEIVGTLPTTNNFEGRTVYLTTDDKLYRFNGTAFVSTVPATDVTGALASAQIASLEAAKLTGQITSTQITDDAITTPKIAAGAVTASEIAAGAITTAKIAAGAITTATIAADAITADKIAAGAITATELAVDSVTAGAIAAGAVSTSELAAGAVTAAKVSAGTITATEIASGAITTAKIAAGAVTATEIAAGAVTATKLAADSVTAGAIAAGAVSTSELAANAVTATQIAADAVTTDKIAAGAVTAPEIAAGAVTADKVAANAITAGKIAASAVSATEIAAGAVTTEKLAVGSGLNTVHNAQFYGGLSGWHATAVSGNTGVMSLRSGTSWSKPGGPVLQVYQPDAGTAGYVDVRPERVGETGNARFGWPVREGEAWEASAGISAHRCTVNVRIEWRDLAGTTLGYTAAASNAANPYSSTDPDLWPRLVSRGTAPTGAAYAVLHLRKNPTSSGADSYMMVYKPLLGPTVAQATEPLPWSPGGYTLVTGDTILTGSIQAANIAANAIDATKIAAGAITATELASGAVTTARLAAGAVTADTIAADAVTTAKIAAGAVTATEIAAGAVTATKIAADTITAGQIAAGAISASEIAADAVNADKIAAGAVTADAIAANAITAGKIATDAITTSKIAANAITSGKIAANAITAGLIAAGAITTSDLIVDGAVSRRVYARGSNVTLTTGLQVIVSKTFGSGSFSAFQGTAGSRSNPILLSLDFDIVIYAGETGWHTLTLQAGLNVSGTWQSDFLLQTFRVPLDAGFGTIQYTKAFVIDSGSWATAAAMRVRMMKAATPARIDASGDYMLTQISV